MDGNEIRKKIDENNKIINSIEPYFTLNNKKWAALNENHQLRMECKHVFKDGVCIYCDALEEEVK